MEAIEEMKEINWDQIKHDMEETMGKLDSIRPELDHEDLDFQNYPLYLLAQNC